MTAERTAAAERPRPPLAVAELVLRGRPPGPFTQADLDALPEKDGYRYELLDGMLIVSPAPGVTHQRMVRDIFRQLDAACPPELEVLFAPFNVKPVPERTFEPDVVVFAVAEVQEREIARPLLAVEVRSPSTRVYDETAKRLAYAEGGIAAYWLIDPVEPSLTALELHRGRYVEVARVSGDQPYQASAPFAVDIRLR